MTMPRTNRTRAPKPVPAYQGGVFLGAKIAPANAARLDKWRKLRRFAGNRSATVDAAIDHAAATGFPAKSAGAAPATGRCPRSTQKPAR